MAGVLEGALVLGVCKLACSLFFLSAIPGIISFCFCCLLMFTDILVTGFLLFLWTADPWPPQLAPHSDLIALRFLLFLGHTYAAALLLATPLVAAEIALRKVWACDGDGAACQSMDDVGCEVLESSVASEKGDARPLGAADADRGQVKWKQLSHAIGYLCCLAVWMVSGLCVGWSERSLEELWVAECLHSRGSFSACLPRMFPFPVEPFWGEAVLSLLLLLSLAVELAAWVRRDKHNTDVGDNNNNINSNNNKSSRWQHLVPAPVRPLSPTTEPWLVVEPELGSVDPEETSSSCMAPTASGWPSEPPVAHCSHPALPEPESAPRDPRRGPDRETEGGLGPQCGHRRPGPQHVVPSLGLIITTGLVGVLSLCTLPLVLSVNVLLVQTMHAVAEGCLETCLAQWRSGEGRSTVLRTL
ncbi:unnamed protein product [Gadus morhua 'NCC']